MIPGPIRVWVVEDNLRFRTTVADLFSRTPRTACPHAVGSCEEMLALLDREPHPDVLLMDLKLLGMSGAEGIRQVQRRAPAIPIVVLSAHDDDERVFESLRAGAIGYLLKSASATELVEAVEVAMRGGSPMNAFIARKVLISMTSQGRQSAAYGLTAREYEILRYLADARSQKQIAGLLGVSPHTVDTHLRHVYAKLQVNSRSGAVAKALRERLL